MSSNEKNGGKPTESQANAVQEITNLINALHGLPLEALQALPAEIGNAIGELKAEKDRFEVERLAQAQEREAISVERVALSQEREAVTTAKAALAAEHAAMAAEQAALMPALKAVLSAVESAHEREAKKDAVLVAWGRSLTTIEQSTASTAEKIVNMGSAMTAGFELMKVQHGDHMRLSYSINGHLSAIQGKLDGLVIAIHDGFAQVGGSVDTLQNSVDKIGLILNKMMDFITHIRDLAIKGQELTIALEGQIAGVKTHTFKTIEAFNGKVMTELAKLSGLPAQVGQKITELNQAVMRIKGEGDSLTKKARIFADTVEARTEDFTALVNNMRELYDGHVRRLDRELGAQMEKFQVRITEDASKIIDSVNETFKKSEMFSFLGQVHSYIEELNHAQAGIASLLKEIQKEELHLSGEIKQTASALKENLSINVKAFSEEFSIVSREATAVKAEVANVSASLKVLNENTERTRIQLVTVAGTVETLIGLSSQSALALGQKFLDEITKVHGVSTSDIKNHVSNEIANMENTRILRDLGDSADEKQ